MSEETKARLFCWEKMPAEAVTGEIDRRLVTGDRSMMAYLNLAKGSVVPQHSHDNEQFTYVLKGALKFWLGEKGEDVRVVNAGEILHIPSNLPHKAEALEDTLDLDVFTPIRQDWLDGTDDYFHKKD